MLTDPSEPNAAVATMMFRDGVGVRRNASRRDVDFFGTDVRGGLIGQVRIAGRHGVGGIDRRPKVR